MCCLMIFEDMVYEFIGGYCGVFVVIYYIESMKVQSVVQDFCIKLMDINFFL